MARGKTAKSILISCGARLALFDIAEVRDLMSEDELELDNLGGYKKINPDTGDEEVVKQKNAEDNGTGNRRLADGCEPMNTKRRLQ